MNALSDVASLPWRECLNLSVMSEDELASLATCETELAFNGSDLDHYLVITPDGRLSIRAVLGDDIRAAIDAGDVRRSGNLKQVLLRFMQLYTARAA